MDNAEPTGIARVKNEPIESHERAVIGRLLQASIEVLLNDHIDSRDSHLVLRAMTQTFERCHLAVRRAAPWVVERETAWLDRRIEEIIAARADH